MAWLAAAAVLTRGVPRLAERAVTAASRRELTRLGRPADAAVARRLHHRDAGGRIGGLLLRGGAGLRWSDGGGGGRGPAWGELVGAGATTTAAGGRGSARFSSDGGISAETGPRFVAVSRDDEAKLYRVTDDQGRQLAYPYVWLRDNCRCPSCYHPSSWQRALGMDLLDPEIVPASESLGSDGRLLTIDWPDGHRSEFHADWLHRLGHWEATEDPVGRPRLQAFGGELTGRIPTFDFQALLRDDRTLHDWLHALNTLGLALVSGAPTELDVCKRLINRVAFIKRTTYGEEFHVYNKTDANNYAYTTHALALHCDQPYLVYMPGVQILHCIEQAGVSGGENQFVDGLAVAERVRKEAPGIYQTLRTQEVDFRDVGAADAVGEISLRLRRTTIEYDKYGDFQRLNISNHSRAPYLTLPVDKVTDLYRALNYFVEMMCRPEFLVEHKLSAGEIATFNNGRVLHGRSAFVTDGASARHLVGAYFDWDEGHSRLRVLREKLFGEVRI